MSAPENKLHFSRFEFKYVFSNALRDEIERELLYFLTLDPFVIEKPNNSYFVRSLYFDNDSFTHYYEKTDGMLRRHKFRLRTYTDDPAEPCATFLEIKGRHDALVLKERAPLQRIRFDEPAVAQAELTQVVLDATEEGPVLDAFRYNLARKRVQPVARVDYNRRPYISRFDPGFRLTFDSDLAAAASSTLFPRGFERARTFLRGASILEVKFSRHVPSWFHRIIQAYNLRRVSISKYCKGIEALGLAQNLE